MKEEELKRTLVDIQSRLLKLELDRNNLGEMLDEIKGTIDLYLKR